LNIVKKLAVDRKTFKLLDQGFSAKICQFSFKGKWRRQGIAKGKNLDQCEEQENSTVEMELKPLHTKREVSR
jgi:hypothetical protein